MNTGTQHIVLQGGAGAIEALRDDPAGGPGARGLALIAHPHPLHGGTMDNKVVQTLARAFVQCGYSALRFNFRGVGASAGVYDEGRGETDDLLAVLAQTAPAGGLALAGFSFGTHVVCSALQRLAPARPIDGTVLVGTAASRFEVPALPTTCRESCLVIHGEGDDTVPLAAVMDWARPQHLPVTVFPGGSHFFHGQLSILKNLVVRHFGTD